MITYSVVDQPVYANEYGTPENPAHVGRRVLLFAGMRGNIERFPLSPTTHCIFTAAQSGARYVVYLDVLRSERHEGI